MIQQIPKFDPDAPTIVIDIGNTTVAMGTWLKDQVVSLLSIPTNKPSAFTEALDAQIKSLPDEKAAAVIICSVVPDVLERIRVHVLALTDKEALVVGQTIPLPLDVDVKDPGAVGVDRVCQAAAAYDNIQTGCTIVSFGTAVTVDLIDDEGVFLGGAILPGLKMQLQSLHKHTATLPEAPLAIPERPYGRDTIEAIQTGVCRGISGAIRSIVEGYASHLNRWPQVVATGGDIELMQRHCDFIDTFVLDLTLRGVGLAYTKYLIEQGV